MSNELIERIDKAFYNRYREGVVIMGMAHVPAADYEESWRLLWDCKVALTHMAEDLEAVVTKHASLSIALTQQQEDYEELQRQYHFLASEMVYEGNSVQHWRQKALAYKECAGVIYELKSLLGVETPADVLEQVKTQQQEAEPEAWIITGTDRDLVPRKYLIFSRRTAELHVAQNLDGGEWQSCAAKPLYLHPPKTAAQPQVPDNGMTVGASYVYTKIGSAEDMWWGCVIVGFDDGQPLIRTDAGHYYRRPLSEYRFRASAAKEEV